MQNAKSKTQPRPYPNSVMTSWHVRASVFRVLLKVVFLSLTVGSSSPSVAVGTEASKPPAEVSVLLLWEETHLNIILKASDGERTQCAALWTTSNIASMNISIARWRSWLT